jgi:hypothetical protein
VLSDAHGSETFRQACDKEKYFVSYVLFMLRVCRCSSRSSVSKEHLMGPDMSFSATVVAKGSHCCATMGLRISLEQEWPKVIVGRNCYALMTWDLISARITWDETRIWDHITARMTQLWRGITLVQKWPKTPELISATAIYVMWREEHLWNVIVLQRVYDSSFVWYTNRQIWKYYLR